MMCARRYADPPWRIATIAQFSQNLNQTLISIPFEQNVSRSPHL